MTVNELCDLYLEEAAQRIKASTLAMDRSRINTHVRPLLGRRLVSALTPEDIERFQANIAAGKTARPAKRNDKGRRVGRGGVATGGRGVAARTVGMLGTMLELGRRRKLIDVNPVREVARYSEGRQRRFLSLDEIGKLGAVIRAEENTGARAKPLAALRLMLMTGLRRMEAACLEWSAVDARARCIRFEDTKSGPQLRPIGGEAVKLIEAQSRDNDIPWVFPAIHGDGHIIGLPKVLARLCAKAGLEGITVHVLRHSFAATAAEMGYSELTIAGLLGHAVRGVTQRYAHVPDAALVAAAERIAARIHAAIEGTLKTPATVTRLHA